MLKTHTHTKGLKTYIGVMKTRAITILDDRYYDMIRTKNVSDAVCNVRKCAPLDAN